ncbi:MAG TPA: type I DNA topoisomerase, partial [Candidatus Doudnabacteria bacterium]|nr:type I DNA topoisomerase [Candidatus Doudnabacteria bacterium]
MSKQLIIVESPTKAKTISKFLGADFEVEASFGHVRDLPKSKLSIDVENNFEPVYTIPPKSEEVIGKLKKMAKKASSIILATDEDREGEAISWHLVEALGMKYNDPKLKRIVFHEITKPAIAHALENPRAIDLNLVDAQQARRVLDRLVGYELSPFLWRKIRYGLSAGRVQSVAVRLIVEREREIQAFNAEEYWSIEALLSKTKQKLTFNSKLTKINDKAVGKMGITNEVDAKKITSDLDGAEYKVADITKKEVKRNPSPPFTTSTLQQEAARKLGFSAKQTMAVAQHLYEHGHITYMRTDSLNLAQSALMQAQEIISQEFGEKYKLAEPRRFANKSKGAQEAHEAIRPTDLALLPQNLRTKSDRNAGRLYDLIWKRTIASQMQQAIFDQTAVDITASPPVRGGVTNTFEESVGRGGGSYTFRANGQVIKFDGFVRAYTEGTDEKSEDEIEGALPELTVGETLQLHELSPNQHFTEPPPRYTDATLVKALEAHGIGRPSTYAPTLT